MTKTVSQQKFLKWSSGGALLFILFLTGGVPVSAQESMENVEVIESDLGIDQIVEESGSKSGSTAAMKAAAIEEQQLMKINQNLKNIIEENKKLLEDRQRLADQLQELRGQREISANRVVTLTRQKEELENQNKKINDLNQQYQKDLETMRVGLEAKQKEFEAQIATLEKQLTMEEGWRQEIAEVKAGSKGKPSKANKEDLVNIEKINIENETLKRDAAKVHYNLGNIYFQQGEYKMARIEYERAVELMPYDAEAHYNLAFVSGEYLEDPQTALKHYQQYLYLKPGAEDAEIVKEKIAAARLLLRTAINSALDGISSGKEQKVGEPDLPAR